MFKTPEVFDPAGPAADSIVGVFWLVLAVSGVIFVAVTGALIYFIYHFREKRDDGETEPPQIYGSQPIELAWTLAPLLTVLVLALVVIRSVIDSRGEPDSPDAVHVRVVGHQWWWEFEYPEHGVTTANELVIPASSDGTSRPILLQLESADVIHSFWIPRLAGKTDLIPGKTNEMWIQADVAGTYYGRCAEYCGTQHAKMLIRVDAVSPDAFEKWIEEQRKPSGYARQSVEAAKQQSRDGSYEEGRNKFMTLACANCHTIRGTNAIGKFGPDLTHLMSRKTLASGIMDNNRENLSRWIDNPDIDKAGCKMPDMRLNDADVKAIVDYLMELK